MLRGFRIGDLGNMLSNFNFRLLSQYIKRKQFKLFLFIGKLSDLEGNVGKFIVFMLH